MNLPCFEFDELQMLERQMDKPLSTNWGRQLVSQSQVLSLRN